MQTWKAVDIKGNTCLKSALTESDARQQAEAELGYGEIVSWEKV